MQTLNSFLLHLIHLLLRKHLLILKRVDLSVYQLLLVKISLLNFISDSFEFDSFISDSVFDFVSFIHHDHALDVNLMLFNFSPVVFGREVFQFRDPALPDWCRHFQIVVLMPHNIVIYQFLDIFIASSGGCNRRFFFYWLLGVWLNFNPDFWLWILADSLVFGLWIFIQVKIWVFQWRFPFLDLFLPSLRFLFVQKKILFYFQIIRCYHLWSWRLFFLLRNVAVKFRLGYVLSNRIFMKIVHFCKLLLHQIF